ncbi:MAG: aspartate kinase [Chlamydiales bacterium]|jgi:aspartate kinase
MSTLIMKFGGASVASPDLFANCASIILKKSKSYDRIVVVVSAMKGMTDQLIQLALKVNTSPQPRECDMLLSVGERISMSLLAMALGKKDKEAASFTGSQSGIITCQDHTNAKIIDVNPYRILPHLNDKKIVIVAGFQGVSRNAEITTLGRGGSDTTAVALGVSLRAELVEFYKDVPGVFSEDPHSNASATLYSTLTYDKAIGIVKGGAQVLHERCIHLAKKNELPLRVVTFKDLGEKSVEGGTYIRGGTGVPRPQASYEEENKE